MCVRVEECKTIYLLLSHCVLFLHCCFLYISPSLSSLFSPVPFLFFGCVPHFGQFARHGDKISEKKEQNVRMKKERKASFVLSSPVSTTGENNAVLLICSVCVAHTDTVRESHFQENGNSCLWYTSLIKSHGKRRDPMFLSVSYSFCAKCLDTVALIGEFRACFSSFSATRID